MEAEGLPPAVTSASNTDEAPAAPFAWQSRPPTTQFHASLR